MRSKTIEMNFSVPAELAEEMTAAWQEILTGEKQPRTAQRASDNAEIAARAKQGVETLLKAVEQHPGTGQSRSIVHFLAALWDASTYRLDTRELRGMDTKLGNAMIDCLNYDRLGITGIEAHISEKTMVPLLRRYGLLPEETRSMSR